MATPHPHHRGVLLVLGLLLAACTAGQYDIQECDPTVPNLLTDLCGPLNDALGMSGCMLYQCDKVSRRCVVKPRDYDRDGDPDLACGGGDCDDTDPTVYSTAFEPCDNKDNNCNGVRDEGCSCDPKLIGTACYDGKGACKRSGQWVCNASVPICNAKAADAQSWHNAVDPVNHSADWDCDGVDALTCCVDAVCNQTTDCPVVQCASSNANSLCESFCSPHTFDCFQATRISRCDDSCGGRTLVCHCAFTLGCHASGSSFGVVGCR
jgi:hypothetical protein